MLGLPHRLRHKRQRTGHANPSQLRTNQPPASSSGEGLFCVSAAGCDRSTTTSEHSGWGGTLWQAHRVQLFPSSPGRKRVPRPLWDLPPMTQNKQTTKQKQNKKNQHYQTSILPIASQYHQTGFQLFTHGPLMDLSEPSSAPNVKG